MTENQQFSPGIINVLLKATKQSHVVGHVKNKKIDRVRITRNVSSILLKNFINGVAFQKKLHVLCDFTSALLEKRFPGSTKQESPIPAQLPSDILVPVPDEVSINESI